MQRHFSRVFFLKKNKGNPDFSSRFQRDQKGEELMRDSGYFASDCNAGKIKYFVKTD
jgi:hypothetical protein